MRDGGRELGERDQSWEENPREVEAEGRDYRQPDGCRLSNQWTNEWAGCMGWEGYAAELRGINLSSSPA